MCWCVGVVLLKYYICVGCWCSCVGVLVYGVGVFYMYQLPLFLNKTIFTMQLEGQCPVVYAGVAAGWPCSMGHVPLRQASH